MLFLPFLKETELLENGSYCEKLNLSLVKKIVEINWNAIEPNRKEIDDCLKRVQKLDNSINETIMFEKTTVIEHQKESSATIENANSFDSKFYIPSKTNIVLSDKSLSSAICSLNNTQRQVFDSFVSWSRKFIKGTKLKKK